jgi:serine/threonine protein kinase
VMLTKAGVKVLDFGLAKSPEDETITTSRMVLGTPAYMAPEQREGKECDARSDILSFGLVLYEMIAGKRALDGSNPAAALEPEGLNRVVRACLAEDPADRFQTARDLKRVIEWSVSGDGETLQPSGARRRWLGWSVAAALAVALAPVALLHVREKPLRAASFSALSDPSAGQRRADPQPVARWPQAGLLGRRPAVGSFPGVGRVARFDGWR